MNWSSTVNKRIALAVVLVGYVLLALTACKTTEAPESVQTIEVTQSPMEDLQGSQNQSSQASAVIEAIPTEQVEGFLLQGDTSWLETCEGLVTVGVGLAEMPEAQARVFKGVETALDELWKIYGCEYK